MMRSILLLLMLAASAAAFTTAPPRGLVTARSVASPLSQPSSALSAADVDLNVVALVAGQENYGLAVVSLGEALWSFSQAPSLDHAKVLIPAAVAALLLVAVSGPMITSGDAASVTTGLFIATGVSVGLGLSYVARLTAKYSPSAKEIAALGLLVAIAGFFSFSQNLVVDGFVELPSIPMPSLPEISLPDISFPDGSQEAPPPLPETPSPEMFSPETAVPETAAPSIEAEPAKEFVPTLLDSAP